MNTKINKILSQFKEKVISQFGSEIVNVIVYGSYAREEQSEQSDLDILVVVKVKDEETGKKIDQIAYEIMWKYNFDPLLSVQIISENHFRKLEDVGSSFYRNIEREGVFL